MDATVDTAEQFNAAVSALERGADAEARGLLEAVLVASPHDGEAILMLAQVERAAGDVEAARDRLKRWVALAPDDLSACVELADLALERGEPGKAATVLREVLAVRPNHWEALLLLGDAFNDVPIARAAGYSIAFNSRCDELLGVANATVPGPDLRAILPHFPRSQS